MTNDQTVTQALEPCPFCGAGDANPNGICSYSKGHEAWWADGTEIRESFFVNCVKCGISNRGMFGHQTRELAITAWNTRTAHSGEGRSNGAGEGLASIVVKLSAIRTALREAHWALDDSEDMSHQDPPVHAVPLDNVMRLHRALKACERFAARDEAWDGPGPLVTQIIEWLGTALSAPQGEVERLARNVRGWLEWYRLTEDGDDCDYLNGNAWADAEALASTSMGLLAALAQPEAGGEHE